MAAVDSMVRPMAMIAKRGIFLAFAAVAVHALCYADVTKLSGEQRKRLERSTTFHEVHAVVDLPAKVVALCADQDGRLADPGQKWEATDYISDPSLPQKRLIWAATDGEYYVVHYERGGRGHSFHILVASIASSNAPAEVLWRGVGGELKDLAAFRAALAGDKLDDRLDYVH